MTLDEKLLELKQEVMIMQKDGKGYGYDYVSGDFGKKSDKVHVWGSTDFGANEKAIKDTAKKYLQTQDKVKKAAIQAIKEDSHFYKNWIEPLGLSESDFFNKLDVKSIFIPDSSKKKL